MENYKNCKQLWVPVFLFLLLSAISNDIQGQEGDWKESIIGDGPWSVVIGIEEETKKKDGIWYIGVPAGSIGLTLAQGIQPLPDYTRLEVSSFSRVKTPEGFNIEFVSRSDFLRQEVVWLNCSDQARYDKTEEIKREGLWEHKIIFRNGFSPGHREEKLTGDLNSQIIVIHGSNKQDLIARVNNALASRNNVSVSEMIPNFACDGFPKGVRTRTTTAEVIRIFSGENPSGKEPACGPGKASISNNCLRWTKSESGDFSRSTPICTDGLSPLDFRIEKETISGGPTVGDISKFYFRIFDSDGNRIVNEPITKPPRVQVGNSGLNTDWVAFPTPPDDCLGGQNPGWKDVGVPIIPEVNSQIQYCSYYYNRNQHEWQYRCSSCPRGTKSAIVLVGAGVGALAGVSLSPVRKDIAAVVGGLIGGGLPILITSLSNAICKEREPESQFPSNTTNLQASVDDFEDIPPKEKGNNFISVYPNPTTSRVNLEMDASPGEEIMVEIYDLTGRNTVNAKYSVKGDSLREEVDISTLPRGIYIMNIRTSMGREFVGRPIIKK